MEGVCSTLGTVRIRYCGLIGHRRFGSVAHSDAEAATPPCAMESMHHKQLRLTTHPDTHVLWGTRALASVRNLARCGMNNDDIDGLKACFAHVGEGNVESL